MSTLLHTEKIPRADFYSVTAAGRMDFDLMATGQHYPAFEQIAGMPSYLVYTEEFATRCKEDPFVPYAYDPWLETECLKQCPKNRDHVTHEWISKRGCLAVSGQGAVTPFLIEADYPVVSEELGKHIERAKLCGVEVGVIDPDPEWSASIEDRHLLFLGGKHPIPKVLRVLTDDKLNHCPFCDHSPLYCEECGHLMIKCSNCGNTTIQGIAFGAGDEGEARRISTETLFPDYIPENRLRYTVDLRQHGQRWDFSGTDICSLRMLECLLDVGAYPIVVTPLLSVYEGDLVGYQHDEAIALADYGR